ncbi:MAG: AAA family ATPase [Fibrobacterota bacterium]
MDLFESGTQASAPKRAPLADRMRPRTIDEFVGQSAIVGKGRLLRRAIDTDRLSSLIFYGPPGCGKTTLARIIANRTHAEFITLNAVLSGVKDIRASVENAHNSFTYYSKRTILFIDEVHRFNKSQQDALLPHVESGVIILIGATTENPYFEVNKALISRSRIFQLNKLDTTSLKTVVYTALSDPDRGYGRDEIHLDEDALLHLCHTADGDARSVLNGLELAVMSTVPNSRGQIHLTLDVIEESIQKRAVLYDKDGDAHYDTISAFIKSIRGSDPDAALYWMAKMVYAGEDPRFIFRRMIILASEDIGLADPNALNIVVNAARAYDYIGMPEGRYPLAQACLYLATAPKSNSAMAFFDALSTVAKASRDSVPDHLKDPSRDREGFGHGDGYLYPHAYRDHWVAQQYLPDSLRETYFYSPSDQGYERSIRRRVARRRELQLEAHHGADTEGTFLWDSLQSSWEKRSEPSVVSYYEFLRRTVIERARISPQDLVLDLDGRKGMLSFEALRCADQGGVWSVARTRRDYEVLSSEKMGEDLLLRPVVLRDDQDESWIDHLPDGIGFDILIHSNAFHSDGIIAELSALNPFLSDTARMVFASLLPWEGSGVSRLCADPVASLIRQYEDQQYSSQKETFFRRVEAFEKFCSKRGFSFTREQHSTEIERRFSSAQIRQWFRSGSPLQQFLHNHRVSAEHVESEFRSVLLSDTVPWKVRIDLISARKG